MYCIAPGKRKGRNRRLPRRSALHGQLRSAGLYLGSEWSESRTGTCGVGSCISTGEAMTIHQTGHFDTTHTPLSCTAAPIFDTNGGLAAVLDISLLRSPQPKVSQNLALHLVTASARSIELANLMAQTHSDWCCAFPVPCAATPGSRRWRRCIWPRMSRHNDAPLLSATRSSAVFSWRTPSHTMPT